MTKSHLVKVYREAAEMVAVRQGFSCGVIEIVVNNIRRLSWSDETKLYQKIMLPAGDSYPLWKVDYEDRTNVRVLLLLLMAEWVKTDYDEAS